MPPDRKPGRVPRRKANPLHARGVEHVGWKDVTRSGSRPRSRASCGGPERLTWWSGAG